MLPLGAGNPLGHVVDEPLFYFPGTGDYGWQQAIHKAVNPIFQPLYDNFGIGKHFFMFCLAGILTLLLFWVRANQARTEVVPGRFGNLIESVMIFLKEQVAEPFLGHHCNKFLPFVWGFFFFILINNLLGLMPFFDYIGHGGNTATANIAITGALAITSAVVYHFLGVKEQGGAWTYFKSLFPHVPVPIYVIIVPVEIIAHTVKPCALAIRLCANMVAGHTLMASIVMFTTMATGLGLAGWGGISLVSFLGIVALNFLELLVAFIQAFVFTFLSTVFLSMAVHPDH